jgi:hypothetical protein
MKNRIRNLFVALVLPALLAFNSQLSTLRAQGTAFTYQGQLQNSGSPANGTYNLQFLLYTNSAGGTPIAGPVTASAVNVANGLFTVAIDFGSSVWNGQSNWLEIAVEGSGDSGFTTLSPRQLVTPTPYAIYAESAGSLPDFSVQQNSDNAPNLVGGSSVNYVAGGVEGATVGGGGSADFDTFYTLVNSVMADFGTIGGGGQNTVQGEFATVAGGVDNNAYGDGAFVGGGGYDGYGFGGNVAVGGASVISGGKGNLASGLQSTVGGGTTNNASGDYSTIAGGLQNIASQEYGTVGGGQQNTNTGDYATISGGVVNMAGGFAVAVGGGEQNVASGNFAMVPGGRQCIAAGIGSLAAGYNVDAGYNDSFVWGDGTRKAQDTGSNQFDVLATGGAYFYPSLNGTSIGMDTNSDLDFGTTVRQMLNLFNVPGAANNYGIGIQTATMYFRCGNDVPGTSFAWYRGGTPNDSQTNSGGGQTLMTLSASGLTVNGVVVSSSDRNLKAGFAPVNAKAVLEKVAALPITSWHFTNDVATTHLGPMAQDFYAAFNIGPDDKHIATVDEGGVALAAIQGLDQKVETENAALRAENADLKKQNDLLAGRLDQLEQAVKTLALKN